MKRSIVFFFALILFGATSYAQFAPDAPPRQGPPQNNEGGINQSPPPNPVHHLRQLAKEELGFTATQLDEFDKIAKANQEKIEAVQTELKASHEELDKQFQSSLNDEAKAKSLVKLIGEKKAALEQSRFEMLLQIKALCDAKQKERFGRFLGELKAPPPPHGRMMEGGMQNRHPRPDGALPPPQGSNR